MLDFVGVEVRSDKFSWVGFREGEDGALDHGAAERAVDGAEGGAIGFLCGGVILVVEVGGNELGCCGMDCAAEGFYLAGLELELATRFKRKGLYVTDID